VLSWQTTVVGDPLYRPFLTSGQSLHEALTRRHSPLIEWSHLRLMIETRSQSFSHAQARGGRDKIWGQTFR